MMEALPWHESQWQRVASMRESGRMPHALMLRGARGLGKGAFATRLAAALLCEGEKKPCGTCRGCRLAASGGHPDFLEVRPEEDKHTIAIDQIRALIDHVWLTTRYSGYKAVVVTPAEAMTRQAANTLLKTLEEPPGAAVFILVSHQSGLLPATIRSRCQMLDFPLPPATLALPWLEDRLPAPAAGGTLLRLADGAPLAALELADSEAAEARAGLLADLARLVSGNADPVGVAHGWRSIEVPELGRWLTALTMDLIRLKSDEAGAVLTHADLRDAMQPVVRRLDLKKLFGLLDACLELRWLSTRQTSFNPQLLLEGMAVRWAASGGP